MYCRNALPDLGNSSSLTVPGSSRAISALSVFTADAGAGSGFDSADGLVITGGSLDFHC